MLRWIISLTLALGLSGWAVAASAQIASPPVTSGDPMQIRGPMAAWASRVPHDACGTRGASDATALDGCFRLELVAARYGEARQALNRLEALRHDDPAISPSLLPYRVYLDAQLLMQRKPQPFAQALAAVFGQDLAALDDIAASQAINAFGSPDNPYGVLAGSLQTHWQETLRAQASKPELDASATHELVEAYLDALVFARMQTLTDPLIALDDQRRYQIEQLLIDTPDGAKIDTTIYRPRHSRPCPAC